MARKTIVTVDVPETATDAEFLSALWDDDSAPTFADDTVSDDATTTEPGTFLAEDGSVHILATGLPDARVPLESVTLTALSVERWAREGRRLPWATVHYLLETAGKATTDKGTAETLAHMANREPVSKVEARRALRAIDYASLGSLTAKAALIDWAGVNAK